MAGVLPKNFAYLAPELLENIFSHLTRQELFHVVTMCRSFALSGRLFLYRHIDFRSDDPHIEDTLALLRGNRTIGVQVFSAIITTHPPTQMHSTVGTSRKREKDPWIDPTFAVYWTRLRALEMRGFPFSDRGLDARNFSVTVRDCCPQLKKFSYVPGYGTLPDNFEMKGLRDVAWHCGIATIEMPIQHTLKASCLSLTSISFAGTIFHSHGKPYDHFLQMDFPSLHTLALGSLQNTVSENSTNTVITRFILRHPTIEHLSLGKRRPTYLLFFQFIEAELKSDSLPSLKSFEGFPENVTLLARRGVRSFFRITELSISCRDEESDQLLQTSLDEMFLAVTGAGTPRKFVNVVSLHYELFATYSHRKMDLKPISKPILRSVDQIMHLCPEVKRLYARLPPMSADDLKTVFGMCDHLEVISLPRLSISVHMPASAMEYFSPISRACTNLRKVIARKPDYSETKDFVFVLQRDRRSRSLQSVMMRESWNEAMI